MASKVDLSLDLEGVVPPGLPVLKDGKNSLVAPNQTPSTLTPRQKASQWAYELRLKIKDYLDAQKEVDEEDSNQLKHELIAVFILALQQDNRQSWVFLHEVLSLVEIYKGILNCPEYRHEVSHYIERILHHANVFKEKLFDLQIEQSLAKVFPEEVNRIRDLGLIPSKNYCIPVPVPRLKLQSPRQLIPNRSEMVPKMTASMLLPDNTNPYSTHIPKQTEPLMMSKPLTIGDIRNSIAMVAMETAARESIWSQHYGTVTTALATEIPEEKAPPKEASPTPPPSKSARSSTSSLSDAVKDRPPKSIREEKVLDMDGRQAVEYFAKLHHLGKIESIYFNIVENRHFKPYDLRSCPKNKANEEHYVFSTFGVLHVYPDQPNESMSLAEWQREAVLWRAISSIPFFKNFLIRKMFHRWFYNKRHLDFMRHREIITNNLLPAIPAFGAAMLQYSRLLKELITIKFLPFETGKTYSLSDFENQVNYKNIQAERFLERFFRYCKMVMDVTAEESFKKLKHCEEQLKKKTVFSKDSLHMQRIKKENRSENLRKAKGETRRLGNFVKLVDQVIVEHMFYICKSQVISFVDQVLKNGSEQRDGFFSAKLVFTKQDVLGLLPARDKFVRVLSNTLTGIPNVLTSNAIPIDGSVPSDHETVADDTESSAPTKSDAAKSVDNMKIGSERRKSTARSSMKLESQSVLETDKRAHTPAGETTAGETTVGEATEVDSQMGVPRSVQGEDKLMFPVLEKKMTATKEEDEMGVATPDMVLPGPEKLQVTGEGFMGQYEPLSKANLEEKLDLDSEYQLSLNEHNKLMDAALEEIDQYCEMNSWLNGIHQFCKKWNDKQLKEFKGMAAYTIEQRLTEFRQWSERVRNFDKNFVTENNLFLVDCTAIHEVLLPHLNDIYLEVVTFVAEEAKTLATDFCSEMKIVLENLKDKRESVDAFAKFAKNFTHYKKNAPQYQQRVEYIKSLYEVIRMGYNRQLTTDEEKYEENVSAAGEAFMMQMQDASEFVNTQTPLMTKLLEDTFQRMQRAKSLKQKVDAIQSPSLYMKLEKEVQELAEKATTGKFLDTNQNPSSILQEMREIREKFFDVVSRLRQASRWREAICGEAYNLDFLEELTTKMNVRQEVWKYVEVTRQSIHDWKSTLFRKMNIKKALEKITEWQTASNQLKPDLPPGDHVLSSWCYSMADFKKNLPVLHKLANEALKERHWKAIFVGMNETYDPNQQYTVHDLLSYDLEEHAQLIHNIYLGAIAEFDLELKINMVNKFWEEREFKLAKHIPDSVLTAKANEVNIADVVKKPSSPRRRTKLEKYRQERAAATMGQPQGLNVADDDFFILIEVEELKYQLQHSRISIKAMMQSPYLGDLVQEVEYWHSALQQIEEITDLWCNCQKKWLYLLKVFEKFDSYKKFQSQSPKFEAVHNKFKDWMRVVSNDSKVLTVVHRKRGEKGYRLLQGDNLRNLFLDLIKSQEEILKHLESLMEACRMEFPRLYFLSNSQMVDFLGISRNPKMLLPTAKKCFPSIQSLTFDLPVGTTSLNPSLDFALHADKLEVTSMHGIHGEEVPLFMRVQAFPKGTKWLRTIESVMKNSMAIILQKCIQARIDEGSRQPLQLLEELSKIAENEDKSSEEDLIAKTIKNTFCHWLLRFPVQSVLVAEGIMWARTMMQALEREETTEVSSLQAGLSTKNEQYIELIREMHAYNGKLPQQMKQRLYILLCGLVNQNIHNRDIMDDVIDSKAVLISSFEWQKVIRYHIDIQHVLRAKREEIEVQPPPPTDTPTSQRKAGRGRRSTKPLAPKVRVDATIEEPPKLSRTRTVVSMDYEFGPCSVVQLGSSLPYDYEYLGPVNRLVLTPLTERTFLSLTQSLRHFHCGTLMGPPGTGKSETIKELAKLLGRAVFTMNCSDDITVAMISQMMMGSVQSGCWTLLDDTDRMGKGLLSVAAQHLEYLRSALRALQQCSDNQYKVRGYTKYDKKPGIKDKIIRRNSLTTLHPLPNTASVPVSELHRQNTVPHGFNEKGLVTYFEDTWIAEKDLRRRRHSIEKEIEIKESEFYKSHKPPPLFYEVTRKRVMKTKSDSQQETQPMPTRVYAHRFLGNIIFAGKLMPASANYGCFMTVNTANPNYIEIPEVYRLLMRPCVMVVPDMKHIAEALLCTHGFTEVKQWSTKLVQLLKMLKLQLKRSNHYQFGLKDLKGVLKCATAMLHDEDFKFELFQEPSGSPSVASDLPSASSTPSSSPIEMKPAAFEEYCLVYALKTTLLSSLGDEDSVTIFNNCLRDIFPAPLSGSENFLNFGYNALMAKTVQDQLAEDNLDETPQLISMIMQLHAALQLKNMIILAGPAGSGKTTCCTTLARAINRLNYLQFAPDHSKDELINERELSKISKRLKDSEHSDEEAFADDEKQSSCSLDDGSWDDEEEVKAEDSDVEETVKKTRKTRPTTKEVSNKPKECADYPKIDIVRLSPTAFPPNQFIGYFEDGMWHGGLLSKIMADSSFMSEAVKYYIKTFKDRKSKGQTEIPSVLLRWIVLDGILHPMWADSLNTLFDEERKLCLANVDRIYVEDTTSVMIETGDLCEASPATISRCTVLYFNKDTVQWKSIFDCWLKKAKNRWILTNYVIKMWEDLVVNVFGPTIKFINSECLSAQVADAGCSTAKANTVAPGIQEVQTFIRFISVLLDKSFLREDFEQKEKMMEENAEKPSLNLRQSRASSMDHFFPTYLNTLKGLFAFSYIWSFGGYLHERYKERFNKFAMDVLYRTNNPIRFPMGGSVFDFCLEDNTGNFIRWSDKQQERTKVMAGGFILTTEVEKYTYLVDLLIGAQQPVLLSGMPGVGKSSLIQNMILPKHSSTSIMMSQAMNSNIFQRTMVAQILELKHKATNTLGGPGGTPSKQQKLLFFIEDLNTSQSNGVYQPPLELLKQVLSDKGTYDQQRQEFQEMSEASFLACSTLPCVPGSGAGHSCSVLSSRLTRLFVNLTLFTPSLEGLQSLYGRSLQNWLEEFPTYSVEHHFEFARAMTLGLLDMYHRIKEKFRPSPANAHYVFTLHDIARVVHGILLMSPRSRTRKMMRKKKDNSSGNRQLSRQSWDRGSRPSLGSVANVLETGTSAPMMRVIAQLWCHECTRTFGDRLILEEDCNWYSRLLEDTVMKYFCMARDDPKSEMAAICEETVSQVGHLSPPLATSEEVLEAEEESSSAKNSEAQDTSNDAVSVKETEQESSEIKSVSMKTDLDTAETKSLSQSQSQSQSDSLQGDTPIPDTASTIQTAYSVRDADTETLTEGVSARHDADSASEYETEMSETTEGTSNSDSSETESEYYYDTPKDYDAKKASLRKASRESSGLTAFRRESYYRRDSSTHSTDTVSVGRETPRSNKLGPGTEGSHTNRASGAGSKVGIPSLKTQSRGSHGNIKMKTVTFKAGLLADWEHEAYFGPLMKLEEIKAPYDSLTDVIFTKFIFMTHSETHGLPVEKGYVESSEDSLADALYTCLNVYNAGTSQRLELVFFSEAIRHISRLSRVLAIQGGHALLLGMTYSTGRATLVRLASYIAHCKLFEPKPQTYTNKNLQIVREHIKRACHHTGILGKPTVLLIHEDLGTECLQDICCLMAEGTSPGLYSEEEIQTIVSMMMPGGVQTKRVDKIEQAFERYLKKVRQNLHIIVCLNYRGNSYAGDMKSLHTKLKNYPGLLKYTCSVDLYKPWRYDAYVKIAEVWLEDQRSKIHIPWHPTRMLEQMNMTAQAIAYIHLSAKSVIERQFCHQKEPLRFYSPLTFMEFVHLFRVISAYIVKTEKENILKHERALSKVNEAYDSINEYKRQVSDLMPKHKAALNEIKQLVCEVEEHKLQYIEALDKCKDQEAKIEELQEPLELLRREAQAEFDKVNPNYQAALTALSVLNKKDLEEVKAYRAPPVVVKYVLNALCLLFDVPQDWENAKLLLIRENVVEDMIFYDKDNIPDDIFETLGEIVDQPLFDPDIIKKVSVAAAGIAKWVHAVYKYAHIHRNMQPRLQNLFEQEEQFSQAQAKLGQLRVDANRIKGELENKITAHKSSVKRAKTIEKHMQSIEKKIARAVNLMEHMSMQHYLWKSELKKAKNHVLTAPGDALVTAACVLYHGPLEDRFRAELTQDWLDRCRQGNFVLSYDVGQERYPLSSNNLDGHYDGHKDSEMSSSHAGDMSSVESNASGGIPLNPEIRIFKYPPAVYDTRKYYRSELKKQGSMEYDGIPNNEPDDSDDEDEQSILITRTGFLLQDILSDFDELSKWRLDNLPTDLHSIQNALLMRVSCFNRKHCWPLLIDPDNQAEVWVKNLQSSQNIFQEKDLRSSTPDEVDGIPLEMSGMAPEDSNLDRLPPSRGTTLTFSDVISEGHITERTTYTSASTITYTTDYTKSGGRHSRNTWNTEELRPVTSVTNSWETLSLRADQTIDHPEFNLWIVEADDSSLDSKLINAIVHGITVLVTHLERKPLDPLFRGLLLKQFFVDKDGNRIIKVGTHEFKYHPNFRLYLSTSVPLFLKGDGLFRVPIHRLCIINMSLSDEAIINLLLTETMKVERKEFEGQKRSNENDIILHRQRLVLEHELIREKTLNLPVPLLEDKTMLESLLACQKEVEKNRMILEETRYMGDHLEEKFANYMNMIMHTAVIFNTIKKMCVLQHFYYLPFYKFIEIYNNVLKERYRGKGSTGAPQSRALELSNAMSMAIYRYVSLMFFEHHMNLFQLLVAIESMRLTRKTSTKEVSLFINGFEKQGLDESALLEQKPDWMASEAWIDCLVLEQLHHPFHGLKKSLLGNKNQWREYFEHPVTLLNPVPGTTLQELSVFQKALLWKITNPDRLSEVAMSLTLYELGSMKVNPDHYNIKSVYSYLDKATPAVFILPNPKTTSFQGTRVNTYITPAHEVKRLAKEVGMDGKVRILNFGVKGQTAEARQVIEECTQNGYWLLLQNYHLADEPEIGFFTFIKDLVYSKWTQSGEGQKQSDATDSGNSLVTHSRPTAKKNDLQIHNTFQLWISTMADDGRKVPGVLVQHGVKVTCEQTCNFKSTLQKSYRSSAFLLNDYKPMGQRLANNSSILMPIALLHSLLLQQTFYGRNAFARNHFWTLTDLALATDMFKTVMKVSHSPEGVQELVSKVYYDHCIDTLDAIVVKSLASTLTKYATEPQMDMGASKDRSGVVGLLKHLLQHKDSFNLRRAVDSLEELSSKTFGLPESADRNIMLQFSRSLFKGIIQVTGAPELFQQANTEAPPMGWYAEAIFPSIISKLQDLPELPETRRNQVYPVEIFLHYEVEGYKTLLQIIQSDVNLLQRRSKGEILLNAHYTDILESLCQDQVPKAWTSQTFPSKESLKDWIDDFAEKIRTLTNYVNHPTETASFNLSVFLRPDRFLEAVKQTYARMQFVDVNCVEFDSQVMPAGINPSMPPKEGVFISGLRLYNALWDTTRGVLMSNESDTKTEQSMPIVWLKPADITSNYFRKGVNYKFFSCPVFCSTEVQEHCDQNVVTFIPLPTLDTPDVWHQARVFMISDF